MTRTIRTLLALALLAALGTVLHAQATTGRISGAVTDAQGGLLQGAAVTATEVRTNFARTGTTDAQGAYVFVNLPLGTYSVAAEMPGFKREVKSGYVLVADGRLTADFTLEVGGLNETVEVSVASETVNTVSGEIARTVDQNQVQSLALNGRNYLQLASLVPGAPLTNFDALGLAQSLSVAQPINGTRGNQNLLTVDGGFNLDSGSNGSQISNVGIDFIEEVSIKTANFSAEYGRNSGAAINVVTRGGTNDIHGSLFGYHRNEGLDANNYFSNARSVARAQLKYNNFGGALGGPVVKDKLFFFAGVEWKQIDREAGPNLRTLPTQAMRAGDFSALSTPIIDPLTKQPFPGNVIPQGRITPDGRAFANVYAAMEGLAKQYSDTATANNATFLDPFPFRFRQEFVRLDYNISPDHRLTGRLLLDHYTLTEPYGTFINSQLPTIPTERNRPGRNVQLSHNWTINNNLLNEAKFNYSGNGQRIPPVGDAWKRETYGFQFPQLYPGGGEYDNSIPNASIQNFASFNGANASLISPTKDWAFQDTLTWLEGNHTVKSGLLVVRNFKDQNGRPPYAGSVGFSVAGNPNSTGNGFADALLGNFRSYNESSGDPIGNYRFWQVEAFATDAWRINDDLSVELGLRYTYHYPTVTKNNNLGSFDSARYNPANAVVVLPNGTLVPGSGDRYNGLTRPGDTDISTPEIQALPVAASRGFYAPQHLFAPRFSFAWSPGGDGKTAVRGGAGLFYDRPEGNLYFSLANVPPFLFSSTYQNGNIGNIAGGAASPITPWAAIDSLDPGLVMPKTLNWSLSVQRELGLWGLFGEVAYVGSKGLDLLRRPDINRASFEDLEANAAGFSTDFYRPYKGFSTINTYLSDAESTYHAMQVFLSKRRGDLRFTVNYTLSRWYSTGSGNSDGDDPSVEWNDPRYFDYFWGPDNNDRTHIFVATWDYALPFFKGDRGFLGQVLGGWEFSGIWRYQTGSPLTISGNTSIGGRRADYNGGEPYIDERINPTTGAVQWLDPAAFAVAPEGRPGNSERGQFRGPDFQVWDVSLRKTFPVRGDVKLQVQADFFNAFNMVNWGNPSTNLSGAGFGTITSANPPRNIQLGLRLMF